MRPPDQTGIRAGCGGVVPEPGHVDVSYLDALAERVAPIKRAALDALALRPGDRVLDVGCGPATDTLALAPLVGPTGRVVGIDADPEMIDTARIRSREAGWTHEVHHQVGDAHALPFEDGAFDAVRSERVFQHLQDPLRAMQELRRVTRPGGRVVVVDSDHLSLAVDTHEAETEWVLREIRHQLVRHPAAGRQLRGWALEGGFEDPELRVHPVVTADHPVAHHLGALDRAEAAAMEAGRLSPEALARWRADLQARHEAGRFLAYVCIFQITAIR